MNSKCKKIFSSVAKFYIILNIMFFTGLASAKSNDAENYINDLAYRVISILKQTNLNEKTKEAQLNAIFLKNVDTKWIARFSMGKYWRTLTPKQQAEYSDLFSTYLIDLYVPNFRKYTGNEVRVVNSTEFRPKEFLVQTELTDPLNKNPIKINYMISQKDGLENFIIFDIIAEGVSLITTQRSEINSVMDNQGFDALISLLKKKTSSISK